MICTNNITSKGHYRFKGIYFFYLATWLFLLPSNTVNSWTLQEFTHRWRRNEIVYLNDGWDIATVRNYFMKLALHEAEKAGEKGEVPIGALVVQQRSNHQYEILSRAGNSVETNHDASAHAELLALRRASVRLQNWRLVNTTLYSTLEPCPMCLAACQAFRINNLVYGAPDLRLGAVETHIRLLDSKHPYHNITDVVKGVQSERSASLLRHFFKRRRKKEGKVGLFKNIFMPVFWTRQ